MGNRAEQISISLPSVPGVGEDPKVKGIEARKDGSRSQSPSSSNLWRVQDGCVAES